jgi:hypothetical protein
MDFLSMDGAAVSEATMCWVGNCPSCWCLSDDLSETNGFSELRTVADVRAMAQKARDDLLDIDGDPLQNCIGKVKDAERTMKMKLIPENAWMKVKNFELFMSCPKDELHQWFLGLYGEHIVPAALHRYLMILTRPDLVDSSGAPLLSAASVMDVWVRIATRLSSLRADTSMITISPDYASHFMNVYINKKEGATYTGDRMKLLMLSLPFVLRELIAPEV